MSTVEIPALSLVRAVRSFTRDEVVIYRVRYFTQNDALKPPWRSEYGGFGDQWKSFVPYEELDFDFPGVVRFTGYEWHTLRQTLDDEDLRGLQQIAELRDYCEELLREASPPK